MLHLLWRRLKVWRRLPLGPVALLYRFDRSTRITRGARLRRPAAETRASEALPPPRSDPRPDRIAGTPVRPPVALIVGVGPGFGHALARRLAAEGFDLLLVCRDAQHLTPLLTELHGQGVSVEAYGADATDESSVNALFEHLAVNLGRPALVVYAVQYFSPGSASTIEVPAFEAAWRHNCLGAFLVARHAARSMAPRGEGTIVLVGSTSSLIGRADHLNLAVGKFGQRALAQVMARELWPAGIHVAHVVIDADISEDAGAPGAIQADPDHIAQSILQIHRQPRTAWTSEIDLRPFNERFWEHC